MTRWFLLASLAAVGLPATASYELALIYDMDNRQILRYDPVARRMLGAFGQNDLGFYGNENRLALDPSRPGTVLALDVDGYVRRFDYSSGIQESTVRLSSAGTLFPRSIQVMPNGNWLVTHNTGATVYRTNGAVVFNFAAYGGYTTLDSVAFSDNTFGSLESTGSGAATNFHLFRRSATGIYTGGMLNFATGVASTTYQHLGAQGGRLYATGLDGGNWPSVAAFDVSGSSYVSPSLSYSKWQAHLVGRAAFAHAGNAFFTTWMADQPTRLYQLDSSQNYYRMHHELPYAQRLGDMVIVAVPEPATLAVVALGLAALIRRRRTG